jgi:hypothetical protein
MNNSGEGPETERRNEPRELRPLFVLLVCIFAALFLLSLFRFIRGKESAGGMLSPAGMLLVWSAFIFREKSLWRNVLLICGGALAIGALVRAVINLSS